MNSESLRQWVDRFAGRGVLVVGDVILDEYFLGDVNRISPEAPVPVVDFRRRNHVPGGAANTAANAAALDGRVIIGGVVGKDQEATWLREALVAHRVQAAGLVQDSARPTTTKTRIIAQAQQVVRLDRESRGALSPEIERELIEWAVGQIAATDVCVISDYAKGVVSERVCQALIQAAGQARKPVIVDPKGTEYRKYAGATVIKPNQREVETVLNREIRDEASWTRAGRDLMELLPGTSLLMSRGPHGMSLFQPGQEPLHFPSQAKEVFDVTGAGDTVVATLALALAAGASFEAAAHLANRSAGIAVSKMGTATISREELIAALGE